MRICHDLECEKENNVEEDDEECILIFLYFLAESISGTLLNVEND